MSSIQHCEHRVTLLLMVTAMVACGSSNADGIGVSSHSGGAGASNGGFVGTGGSGNQATGGALEANHCVIKVSGASITAKSYDMTGPLSFANKGVDARYQASLDQTGFYCESGVANAYSVEVDLRVSGRLDQQIPYSADETTGNYVSVGITYSLVPSFLDTTTRQWWSCHGGKDELSGSVAKGAVGKFSVALDAATPQNFVNGKPDDYLVQGTLRAECPPFAPDPSVGVAGTDTVTFDVTLD